MLHRTARGLNGDAALSVFRKTQAARCAMPRRAWVTSVSPTRMFRML
ncbi:hypothetical protein PV416_29525 [Streptomyces ipomoeae]|uniref:Uncharacterized protein n=1 Tax=Streptomyces ipomoeae 91-03 TaxID=698759 RepID=L1KYB1_9ACTN|nr:hypothetical protein [Streptomyces ipomoeae]EKX65549.1 hypothetical protein STRIP9103_01299 [Streptomyces ipomoeae 91-03]MDX2695360.1 hypothetical protein [Streptomyces ipomoeae]MDX2825120.1 hypothetical protein [Streptomyces ipomoeae]MDX2842339.1 hypothetical protein [Streptomyces ipomoeae]MDX2876044.1 hypothetical protein [Streptomyces ipomoeae]